MATAIALRNIIAVYYYNIYSVYLKYSARRRRRI